jgi:cell division septum initiation protein DivIVA
MTDSKITISTAATLSPDDLVNPKLTTSFRGFSESEVRALLRRAADALKEANERAAHLAEELEAARSAPAPASAPAAGEVDLLDALGEETAQVLRSAREAAADLRRRAEESATRVVAEAQEEADRLRTEAAEILEIRTREAEEVVASTLRNTEAQVQEMRDEIERYAEEQRLRADRARDTEIENARTEARRILVGADTERLAIVEDLARRRSLLVAQIEELRRGRDHLIEAYRVVKRTFLEATDALGRVEQRVASGELVPGAGTAEDPAVIEASAVEEEPAARGDGAIEPSDEPAAAEEAGPEQAGPEPEPGSEAEAGSEAAESAGPTLDDVESLFARLRAAQEHPEETPAAGEAEPSVVVAEPGDSEPAEPAESEPEPAAAAEAAVQAEEPGAEARLLAARDDQVGDLAVSTAKRVKRALQDEQNEILDAVRRHKRGPLTSAEVVPPPDAHLASWSAVLGDGVGDAYAAGRAAVSAPAAPAPESLVADLAATLAEPLRQRLVAAVDGADDTAAALDRIGARSREWKQQELDAAVLAALRVAYATGAYDGSPDDSTLHWVAPDDGCSADCHDNALEPTRRGEAFPTGHTHPPSYPGCRCLAVPAGVLAAPTGAVTA